MKTRKYSFGDLKHYKNSAIILFRGIELKFVSKKLRSLSIRKPSMDLGSGDGFIASVLFKDKIDYGVDNDENKDTLLSIKNKRYRKVLIESAEKMSLKTKSLNFVFSNSVIEHIPDNRAVLSEVSRVLKKDGLFVFSSPTKYFTKYLEQKYGKIYANFRNKQLNHFHLLDHKSWKKRLARHNLKVIYSTYYTSQRELLFWEKLVWKNKLLSLLKWLGIKNNNSDILKIKKIINNSRTSKKAGANILIVAKKK